MAIDASSPVEEMAAEPESLDAEPIEVETTPEASAEGGTGLESNVAGALSYLLGPLTGVLFYVLEPEDAFVRFHAAQSTIVFGGLFVASLVLSVALTALAFVPVVGWIAAAVLGIASLAIGPIALVAWVFLMYKAYEGDEYEVPLVAPYARKYGAVE